MWVISLLKHYLSQAVGKHEKVVVLDEVHQRKRFQKLLFCFAAESDDLKQFKSVCLCFCLTVKTVCMPVHMSICLFVPLSVVLSLSLFCLPICIFVCLCLSFRPLSLCLFHCLSVCPYVFYLLDCFFECLPVGPFMSVHLSLCLPICFSFVCLSTSLFVHLSFHSFVCLAVSRLLPVGQFVRLSFRPFFYLSVCLYIHSFFTCLSVSLTVCLCIFLSRHLPFCPFIIYLAVF